MHARAATAFVQIASKFTCEISVKKGSLEINGKSIMGVLQLAACKGQQIEVIANGPDSQEALESLGQLINDLFGEEE